MTDKVKAVSPAMKAYLARKEVQTQGIWCSMIVGKVKIKHAKGNEGLQKRLSRIEDQTRNLNEKEQFLETVDVMADEVVLDWEAESFGGEYSKEAFIVFATEARELGFIEDIMKHCMDMDMLNAIAVAKVAKN